jgi:hypothetical protein
MNYLLLIYGEEAETLPSDQADAQAMHDAYRAFTEGIAKSGVLRGGDALEAVATATTVRVRGGEVVVTDGPFAETKEQLGGYYLIECADLDAAISIAAGVPGAVRGSIEIRPIRSLS